MTSFRKISWKQQYLCPDLSDRYKIWRACVPYRFQVIWLFCPPIMRPWTLTATLWQDAFCDVGCASLLMTYFTEKNHNIWNHGEARGRLLLAKIVGCYIPCSITLYGCMGYICWRNDVSVTLVLVCVGNKNIVIFMKFGFQIDGGVQLGFITL